MVETSVITQPDAAELAEWNQRFDRATPQELLAWAAERWGTGMVLSCSFGGGAGMVLLDMIAKVAPATPVLYIDTGLLFHETYELITQVRERYNVQLRAIHPARTVAQQAQDYGPALWQRDPDRCCQLRKVQPLTQALEPFDAWITGIRRSNSPTRANAALIEWSTKYNLVKLNPLASWREQDVWQYIHIHDVPYNPQLDQGYPSLGGHTCTRLPTGDNLRSRSWVGFSKTACGLHIAHS